MAMSDPDQPLLVFLHVPKTGGSTLRNVLLDQYGPRATAFADHERQDTPPAADAFLSLGPDRFRRLEAVGGHFPYGIHESLGRPARYVTLLRDPIARVISNYFHDYRRRGPGRPGLTLAESLERPNHHNLQTRMLGSRLHWDAVVADDAVLARAKQNLAGFASVGLVERFDQSVMLMRTALGWSWPFYVRHNANPVPVSVSELPSGLLKSIVERNAYDMELYRWALERFEKQVSALGPRFAVELAVFRRINRRPIRVACALRRRCVRRLRDGGLSAW